jgi:uncharacterized membrane protein HdeD (DUF308 family)
VIGIIAGILTFAWPGITAIVLLYLIAFWAILTGVFEIVAGIRLRKAITNEWLLILMGLLSLLFGSSSCLHPGPVRSRLYSGSVRMPWCSVSFFWRWHSGFAVIDT